MQFCSSQLKKTLAELGSIRERQQRAKDTGFPDSESPEIEDIKSTATNPCYLPPFYICCCALPDATHSWRGSFDLTGVS